MTRRVGLVALSVFCFSMIVAILGLGNSVSEIREAERVQTPDALLASAGVEDGNRVNLPVVYYDQRADECVDLYDSSKLSELKKRQFEWESCDYRSKRLEQGLAADRLGDDGLPVAQAGQLTPNRGIDFKRWFQPMEGQNAEQVGALELRYEANGAEFSFEASDFYPVDAAEFSQDDAVNDDGHNHLFTMSFAVPFRTLMNGDEKFVIRADDDTFVFLNDQLVLDMGGVHGAMTGGVTIDTTGEVFASMNGSEWTETGVILNQHELATLRVFHADRDARDSVLELEITGMQLMLENESQIAANIGDDSSAGYAAPLGESKVFQADTARSLMIIATIEGATVILAAVLLVAVARLVVKQQFNG